MIVVAPTVTEEGLPAVVERVSGYVTEQGGTVTSVNHESPWGRRRLAYSIQNFTDAYYVLYYFDSPPVAIEEIERSLRLDSMVIRHLVIKYDPLAGRPVDETEEAAATIAEDDEDSDTVVSEEPAGAGTPDVAEPADDASDSDDEAAEEEAPEDEAATDEATAEEPAPAAEPEESETEDDEEESEEKDA